MSRLEAPLVSRTLKATGDDVIRAELDLEIKTNQGTWQAVTFLVDPGTEMTTMLAFDAKQLDLPIPIRPVRGLAFQSQEVRPGLLRARIVGMDATEYVFPCYFVGNPSVRVTRPKNLLGLTGVIDKIRLTFDGPTPPQTPHGVLIVEKR